MPNNSWQCSARLVYGFLLASLCTSLVRGAEPLLLKIKSPQEYQVIQQNEAGVANVPLGLQLEIAATGKARLVEGIATWEVQLEARERIRAENKPFPGSGEWKVIAPPTEVGDFAPLENIPAGGWYRLSLRGRDAEGKVVAQGTVQRVGVGDIYVVAGQSNSANSGAEKLQTETELVASFDGKGWHRCADPQLGAGGNGGSFMPPLGDILAKQGKFPIGLVPLGQGGTSVREWLTLGTPVHKMTTTGAGLKPLSSGQWECNGELFKSFSRTFAHFGPNGFRAVLWHQGESDAGQARSGYPADRQISGEDYTHYMQKLIEASHRAAGWPIPWLTAVTTYHSESDAADEEFRSAQMALWKMRLSEPGPDTDALRAEYRDGVHFNGKGQRQHAALWANQIFAWQAKMALTNKSNAAQPLEAKTVDKLSPELLITTQAFVFPWSAKPAPKTEFRSYIFADQFHFSFAVEDETLIVDPAWVNESSLDYEDRVEIFFARDAELKQYYCLEIDPLGRVHDYAAKHYRQFDSQWNCRGLVTSGKLVAGGYRVEGSLPLSTLQEMTGSEKPGQTITAGTEIRFGLFRADFYGSSRGTEPDNWLSVVRPTTKEPDFHIPSAFRVWKLPAAVPNR